MKATVLNAEISRGNGYGQYIVTGQVNGEEVKAHSTNSEAFDWFNDDESEEKHQEAIYYVKSLLIRTWENM